MADMGCNIAQQQVEQYLSDLRKSSVERQIGALGLTALVSNPTTHLGYAVGQAANALTEGLSQHFAGALDALISSATGRDRVIAGPSLKAAILAIPKAAEAAGETYWTGVLPGSTGLEGSGVRFSMFPGPANDWAQAGHDFVHHLFGAKDAFFQKAAYDAALESRAKVQALNEGFQGGDLSNRVRQLVQAPPDTLQAGALHDSLVAIYTNKNVITSAINSGKSAFDGLPGAELASTVISPFNLRPANLALRTASYVPGSVLISAAKNLPAGATREFLMDVGRNVTGAGLLAAGAFLAKAGLLKGPTPQGTGDAAENRRNAVLGIPSEAAIKIGDKWASIPELGPAAAMLGLGGTMFQAMQGQRPPATAAGLAMQQVFGRSSLPSLRDAVNLADPTDPGQWTNQLQRFAESRAGMIVPGVVAQVAKAADPLQARDTQGEGALQSMENTLQNRIPGYRNELPPRRDVLGEPTPNVLGPVGTMLSPVPIEAERNQSMVSTLDRLGISLGMPGKSVTANGIRTPLSPEEQRQYLTRTGPAIKRGIQAFLNGPEYPKLNDDARRIRIQDLISDIRSGARDTLKTQKASEALRGLHQ